MGFFNGDCLMIYFFCVLLTIVILCGKPSSKFVAFCLTVIDLALIFAILKIGGWL